MAAAPGRAKARSWAAKQWDARVKEHPPGSNRGHPIEDWQRAFGSWLVGLAWCGVFAGTALKQGGVKVTARVAAVALIEDDAKAGINGFERIVDWRHAMPGDLAILFGRGVHVELITRCHKRLGYVTTYGGNTSYEGAAGSQSNGGCVAKRHRRRSDVYAIVRPRYPRR
jgi:hypothetical protein